MLHRTPNVLVAERYLRSIDSSKLRASSIMVLGPVVFALSLLIGCVQSNENTKTSTSLTTTSNAADSTSVNEADAIEIATNYLRKRQSLRGKFKASATMKSDGNWAVLITLLPARPGSHVFVLVSKDGHVERAEGGA